MKYQGRLRLITEMVSVARDAQLKIRRKNHAKRQRKIPLVYGAITPLGRCWGRPCSVKITAYAEIIQYSIWRSFVLRFANASTAFRGAEGDGSGKLKHKEGHKVAFYLGVRI